MLFLQGTSDLEQHIDYSVGPAGPAKYLTVKIKEGSLELVIEVCVYTYYYEVSLMPRPHLLMRKNSLLSQVEFLR